MRDQAICSRLKKTKKGTHMFGDLRWKTVTPELSRAARAWLNWSQSDLADRANVSLATIRGFEIGTLIPLRSTLTAVRKALEKGGVRFLFAGRLAVGIVRADVEISRLLRPDSEVTWADVEAVRLPLIVNGCRFYPNSKRALVIKTIIALLKKKEWATYREILETLKRLEIDITSTSLSAILAHAKGLFYSCRRQSGVLAGWSMTTAVIQDEQDNNESRRPPT